MRTERFIADLACLLFNLVSAPVSEHIDEDSLVYMLTITHSRCVICTQDVTHKFIKAASHTKFSSPDDLIYESGKIFINTDGKRKKVGISRWLAEQQDWNAFLQAIEQMKKSEGLKKQPYAQRSVG
jgi:long-subunit acyl-CoA synthetase (AMP-forming)